MEGIRARVVIGQGEAEEDLGDHQFATMPRLGEQMLVYHGDLTPLRVTAINHLPMSLAEEGEKPQPWVIVIGEPY